MSEPAVWYRWIGADLEIRVRVQPRAPRDEWCEALADALKVRIKAPPVEGKANAALKRFVAESFGVSQSKVELVAGDQSRGKRLLIREPRRFPLPVDPPPFNRVQLR